MCFGKLVLVKCETLFVSLLCSPLSHMHTHTPPHLTSSFQTVSMPCATVLILQLKCVPELVKVGTEEGGRERRRGGREGGRKRRGKNEREEEVNE